MANQPNIPYEDVSRLLIDDTTPVRVRFWASTLLAQNLGGKTFRLVIYEKGAAQPRLTINEPDLQRPEGDTGGLLQWNAEANRTDLSAIGTAYTAYLFEITGGKQEPRLWFSFKWLTEPPAYATGTPLEPPEIALNYGGVPPVATGIPVYGNWAPAFATLAEAKAAEQSTGMPLFITVNGFPAFKAGNRVYLLTASEA